MHEHVVEYLYSSCSKEVMKLSDEHDELVKQSEGAGTRLKAALLERSNLIYMYMNEAQEERALAISRLRKLG